MPLSVSAPDTATEVSCKQRLRRERDTGCMNGVPRTIRRFLDVEAAVSDDESSSEGWDHEDEFNDDRFDPDITSSERPLRWNDLLEQEEGFHDFLQGILGRSKRTSAAARIREGEVEELLAVSDVLRLPTELDFPLWWVRCRFGLEENIVFFLLQKVAPRHEVRSAFCRGSVRGWIYLEATMNETLQELLKLTPGVCRWRTDVVKQKIKFEDWTKLLTYTDDVKVGRWVRVQKGKYKGDIGFVSRLEPWGGLGILLIARLPSPSSTASGLKRKRAKTPMDPALFCPELVKHVYGVDPTKEVDGVYAFEGQRFEHGLLYKTFDPCSISTTSISIPTSILALFQQSRHPAVSPSKHPRPSEWIFNEGKRVCLVDSARQGVLQAILPDFAEVDFASEEGVKPVPWSQLRKWIVPGDFVEATSGVLRGWTGWVDGVCGDVVSIVNHARNLEGEMLPPNDLLEHNDIHINWLKLVKAPILHISQSTPSTSDRVICHDRVPWVGTNVIITKVGHPLKGMPAVIKDVLCSQQTASGLRVAAQITSLDPAQPFKSVVMDYDDVVETISRHKLYEHRKPKTDFFRPKNFVIPTIWQLSTDTPTTSPFSTSTQALPWLPGSGTPTYGSTPFSTPAWDPSCRTPVVIPESTIDPLLNSRPPSPPSHNNPQHLLLDPRLIDIKLKAIVNGGEFHNKELVVFLVSPNGRPHLRYNHYHTSNLLCPDWVSPKNPNPTRDNGLLVVINGKHCGKCVRRIHHRYENEKPIMMLAVTKRMENGVEHLTGEQFELESSHLCVAFETTKEKSMGTSLMSPLRKEARKIRAK